MEVSDFDYKFPSKLIAKFPSKVRGQSRLLVLNRKNDSLQHRKYADLVEYVKPGDVIVLNNTRVIKARLIAQNSKDQNRELLLLEKHSNDNDWHTHRAIYRGSIKIGEVLSVADNDVEVASIESEGVVLLSSKRDLFTLAEAVGKVPLPPYIKREATDQDVQRYQTEFANEPGSVAAPTASLNFTSELVKKLETKGARVVYLTLHVGMGTFLPIRTTSLEDHKMHEEYFEIPKAAVAEIQNAKKSGHRVVAVGTTVTRTLEYCAKQILEQKPQNLSGEADIFIYPGYKFKVIDQLLTNFHAPKSTVLMMAAAFAGWDNLKKAYDEAIKEQYALLSYGDSMLIT